MGSSANEDLLAGCIDDEPLLRVVGGELESVDELLNAMGDLDWLIFLDDMAAVVDDSHRKLALHLRNRQLLVHSLAACKDELLLHRDVQKRLREASEPFGPVRLASHEICAPDKLCFPGLLVDSFDNLGGHRDTGASFVFNLATLQAVFDQFNHVAELRGSVLHDLLHERQGLHRRALDNINHEEGYACLVQRAILHLLLDFIRHFGCDRPSH